MPLREWIAKKPIGETHCERHLDFSGENWYAPAISKIDPGTTLASGTADGNRREADRATETAR